MSPSSPQDNSKMPLMEFLTSEVSGQYSPGGDRSGEHPMTRQRSTEVVFSRQVKLNTHAWTFPSRGMPQACI